MADKLGRSWRFVDFDQVAAMVQAVPLFSGLGKSDLRKLIGVGTEREFAAGDNIVKQGEGGSGFYLILEGSAEVRRRNRTLSKLKAGDFFGEMSLLDEKPRSADVIASSQTKCLVVSPSSLNRLISSSPNIAKQMLTEIAGRLRATTDLLSE